MGLKKHLNILCNEIGERHLGSEGERQAQKYIEEEFKEIGYEVLKEDFSAPCWNYGKYFLKTENINFPCFPCFYSNSCDIKGQPVIINPTPFDNLDIIDIEKINKISEIIFFTIEKLLKIEIEREKQKLKFMRMRKNDFKEVEKIVKKIWTMGVDKLREETYGIIGNKSWDEWVWKSVKEYLKDKNTKKFVTKINGKIVGFCSYRIDKIKKIGTVGYNGVLPEYSGMGIGTYQINKILELMKKEGMEIAEVLTGLNEGHAPARRMYEKANFKEFFKSILYTKKL